MPICKGTTAKGEPCKKSTPDPSGYCDKHKAQASGEPVTASSASAAKAAKPAKATKAGKAAAPVVDLKSYKAPPESPDVVCLKGRETKALKDDEVYCGPRLPLSGWDLPASIWKNPYTNKKFTDDESLAMYEEYLKKDADLMAHLPELKGKKLACFCKYPRCHAHVIAKYVAELK